MSLSSDKLNRLKSDDLEFPKVLNAGGVKPWQKHMVKVLNTVMLSERETVIILLTQDYHLELNI